MSFLVRVVTLLYKSNMFSDHGSTYVRWGRKQCSGVNTEMIYTGISLIVAQNKKLKLDGGGVSLFFSLTFK